jgi:hypothetical protein
MPAPADDLERVEAEGVEDMYECIADEVPGLTQEVFDSHLDDLIDRGYIIPVQIRFDDEHIYYKAKQGLRWPMVKDLADPVQKVILRQLIENRKTCFILFNTQKGKARLAANKLKEWQNDRTRQIVAFVTVLNDTTLGDQTLESFLRSIDRKGTAAAPPRGVFMLSGTYGKKTIDEIVLYIDTYHKLPHDPDYPMPIIVSLQNEKQIAKVVALHAHVRARHSFIPKGGLPLCYADLFDEADVVYPPIRSKLAPYLVDDDTGLHELVFVTATDGVLLDDPDYPECANAVLYKTKPEEGDLPFYRAYHTADAVHEIVPCLPKTSNNQISLELLRTKAAHFKGTLTLPTGEVYYRKIIINSNAKGEDMRSFAVDAVKMGYNAITFNQSGLTLHQRATPPIRIRTRGKRFNELLFYVYKRFGLDTKPLIILGRKKVDRGLGFHYAPRRSGLGPTKFEFDGHGEVHTDGKEGLIWTDMFVGRIELQAMAVQKAGRLAGIISHCPQYPGVLTWWVEEMTGKRIERHNKIVDDINELKGSHTALQAKTVVEANHPEVRSESSSPAAPPQNEVVTEEGTGGSRTRCNEDDFESEWSEWFHTEREAMDWWREKPNSKPRAIAPDEEGFLICSGAKKGKQTIDAIEKLRNGKKTANVPAAKTLEVGKGACRRYVAYLNMDDPTTARFCVHWIRRIR